MRTRVAALEGARFVSNIQIMGITLSRSALLLMLAFGAPARADPDAGTPSDKPDAAPPLVLTPSTSASPAEPHGETGRPAPPSLDSTRSPMPDRLANDHWMQYYPMAPPTQPVPDGSGKSGGTSGGGANRTSTIFGPTVGTRPPGGAPPDIPRDSVTRTPEDQMAPSTPSLTP
jgi:hypothetical protein